MKITKKELEEMKMTKKKLEEMADSYGNIYLSGTGITSLPDNLTVGGWLDMRGTGITSLPDNLTVGGWLDMRGTGITKRSCKRLHQGDYVPGKYLYADGILSHVRTKRTLSNGFTLYVGKIKGHNVISDGKNFAHCKNAREGVKDLLFKRAADRGSDQFRDVSLDDSFTVDELVTMYRIITGACRQGSQSFVDSLGALKKKYTIREAIEITKGQYNAEAFKRFFEER